MIDKDAIPFMVAFFLFCVAVFFARGAAMSMLRRSAVIMVNSQATR